MTRPVRVSQVVTEDGASFVVSLCFDPERIRLDGKRGLEITLSAIEAGLLDSELLAAASPPDTCDDPGCAMYAVVSIGGVNYCATHQHREGQAS